MTMRSGWRGIVAGVGCGVGLLSGCHKSEKPVHDPMPVQAATVKQSIVPETHHYSATLQPNLVATLRFRQSGYVVSLRPVHDQVSGSVRHVEVGDSVPEGGVLASLRKIDFTSQVDAAHEQTLNAVHMEQGAGDQLLQSQAKLEKDEKDFLRAKNLYAKGAETGQNYDRSKSQYESSLAERDNARKQLEAKHDSVGQARAVETNVGLNLTDANLKAPFPGIVLSRSVDVGDYTNGNQEAFRFGDVHAVKANFNVAAEEVAQFHVGDPVSVQLPNLRGETVFGHILVIEAAADQQSRLFQIQVILPNPDRRLLVGTTGSLELKTGLNKQKISIPFTALIAANPESTAYTVFVLKEENGRTVSKLRSVYLTGIEGDQAILSGGVQAGEQVIDRPSEQLRDGLAVAVTPTGGSK